ncbi:hypothetical protein HMPREF1076_03093 [Parabacteroides goldsteinii CL02T12C30]|uniref:Arylsulfotransferase N-terminal domain-containing protein n=2 Tax=Parabacteroides goldsteinii TaxID=328812 RepID=K5ZBJ7_9BACT|nr:hypothetical protein HMPREF1076_03093 [Parabacteroides goldsteinii CL02T12C30]
MIMKTNITYIFFLILLIFTACNEDQEETVWISPEECTTIKQLIENNSFLKEITENKENYTLSFETQTITLNQKDIKDIAIDKENWNTTIMFPDNSTLNIPTIGTSINQFIGFVNINPSKYNPLAAEVRLNLPGGGAIKTIVHTKEGYKTPDIEHQNAFTSQNVQFITVLGLYENYTNKVELIYTDRNKKERGRTTVDIPVKALTMDNLPLFHVAKALPDRMEPGLNLVNSPGHDEDDTSRPYMVDMDGEIRWLLDWRESKELLHIGAQCGLHRLPNGNFITGDFNNNQLVEVDLLGNLIRRWSFTEMGYSYHHEVLPAANGRYLITVTKPGALHADGKTPRILDFIIEFDPESGNVTKEWDLSKLMDTERINAVDASIPGSQIYGQSKTNWLHNNGVAERDNYLVATARWQGVFGYDKNETLKWIISPHKDWGEAYKPYLLQPLDRNGEAITDEAVLNGLKPHPDFEWVWGVHCPNILPNGHILVFDNGYCRDFIPRLTNNPESYSRVVEYEIDEKKKTIRQVWQYGKERGRECYSSAISGVQYLPETDNRLFCPGQDNRLSDGTTGGRIIEIDPRTGEVVFELEVNTNTCASAFHRANRISLYPEGL